MPTNQTVIAWLTRCRYELVAAQDRLTELDAAIGDGDHGLNMRRGFDKVVEKLPTVADKDVGAILKASGMTLLSSVGGASGPLYGTFLMRAATEAGAATEIDGDTLVAALEAGLAGVIQRGRAEPGEKTMCDVWRPAIEALRAALAAGESLPRALEITAERAAMAVEETAPMIARKGRASYLGERSVGHVDPGAASSALLLKALSDTVAR